MNPSHVTVVDAFDGSGAVEVEEDTMTETEKLTAVHDLRRQVNAENDAARDHFAAAFALEAEIARLQGDDLSARWYDALAATYRARFSPETWAEYERLAAERNGTKTETDAAGAAQ